MKFVEKQKSSIKVDSDPLHVADAHFVKPLEVLMIETTYGIKCEQAYLIDSLAELKMNTTDGFENEQVVTTDLMVAATVETTEGLKSGNGNLSKPQEVMIVDIVEEPEGNQGDKEKWIMKPIMRNCLKK